MVSRKSKDSEGGDQGKDRSKNSDRNVVSGKVKVENFCKSESPVGQSERSLFLSCLVNLLFQSVQLFVRERVQSPVDRRIRGFSEGTSNPI